MSDEREWLVWLDIPHAGTAKIVNAPDADTAIQAAIDLYLNKASRDWDSDYPDDRAEFVRTDLRAAVAAKFDAQSTLVPGGDQGSVDRLREEGPL